MLRWHIAAIAAATYARWTGAHFSGGNPTPVSLRERRACRPAAGPAQRCVARNSPAHSAKYAHDAGRAAARSADHGASPGPFASQCFERDALGLGRREVLLAGGVG